MKKIIIYIFYSIIFSSVSFSQNWTQLNSGVVNDFYSVNFTSEDTGYVVGGNGTILKTTDGGISWNPQNAGTPAYLFSVFFVDSNNGIIVGDSGIVLKTINAGANWIRYATGSSQTLWSVYFTSITNGVAVGTQGTIIKTIDGGLNWITIPPISILGSTNYELNSIYFVDNLLGYAAGDYSLSGVVLKTIDGGTNWVKIIEGSYDGASSIVFVNDSTGWISCGYWIGGPATSILKTNDFGMTWNSEVSSPPSSFHPSWYSSMFFVNSNKGFVGGRNWEIMATSNAGLTWELAQTILPAPNSSINSIYFPNDTIGYAVGDSGRIIKTINGGGVGIQELNNTKDNLIIYPNPNNGSFTLEFFEQGKATKIKEIKIYDILGKILWSNNLSINNRYNIDISNQAKGLYFVKIENENGVVMKKIIVK